MYPVFRKALAPVRYGNSENIKNRTKSNLLNSFWFRELINLFINGINKYRKTYTWMNQYSLTLNGNNSSIISGFVTVSIPSAVKTIKNTTL